MIPGIRRKRLTCRGLKAVRLPLLAYTLAVVPGVLCIDEVAAGDGGSVYVGLAVPVGGLDVSFDKTVDTRAANTVVPESRRGLVLQDRVSGDGLNYGAGAIAGFRLHIGDSGFYIGGQAEIDFRGGEVEGEFDGIGMSAGRNQLGEFWPDQWTYEGNRSYGLAIRLGGSPAALRPINASVYAIGGVRWLDGSFTNRFHGCLSPTPCSPAPDTPDFTSGSERRDTDLDGWMIGLGVEKAIQSRIGLRLESRYTSYKAKRWVTPFNDVGVMVPSELDARAWSVVLSLAWYL